MTDQNNINPQISWDGKAWQASLPVGDGKVIEARWEPGCTYVIRIREQGSGEWSIGFETPIPRCTFVGLKPGTEYAVEVRTKNADGEGDASRITVRTNPTGDSSNVIPFPKR